MPVTDFVHCGCQMWAIPEVHTHGIPVEYAEPGTDAAVAWDSYGSEGEEIIRWPHYLVHVEDGK